MVLTREAEAPDLPFLVDLQHRLFQEDAGVHGAHIDLSWPQRDGSDDLQGLMASPSAIVLVAAGAESVVGFLAGYSTPSSPTHHPVDFAVLRSMYVQPASRDHGIGTDLVEAFLHWASTQGCVEAHVDAYVANESAQRFYQRHGFRAMSVSRVRTLA